MANLARVSPKIVFFFATAFLGIRKAKIIIEACGLSITPEEWVKMANETSWAMLESEVVDLMPGVTKLIDHLHANNIPIGSLFIFH